MRDNPQFVKWLTHQEGGSFRPVQYAVFGCGNREWQHTYQATSIFLDNRLKELGAQAVADRGQVDAGEGNIFADFDTWQTDHLWPGIANIHGNQWVHDGLLDTVDTEPLDNNYQNPNSGGSDLPSVMDVEVEEIKALTAEETRPKFWAKLKLPKGAGYDVGDYLQVYPRNSVQDIERLKHALKKQGHDETDPVVSKISSHHELSLPASSKAIGTKQIEILIQACASEKDKAGLSEIAKSSFNTSPTVRPSILELLLSVLALAQLVTLLPPIRPRLDCISSSPLASPNHCALTWSLITRDGAIPGLASNRLAGLQPGDTLTCASRPGHDRFRPPPQLSTPIIMIYASVGIAPFLGFVAHRAEMVRREPALREQLAPMLLYIVGRSLRHVIHPEELRRSAVIDVRYANSKGEADAASYVPVLAVFITLTAVVVAMRLMARVLMALPLWWDDFANSGAMLLCLAYTVYAIKIKDGGSGIDLWAVPLDNISDLLAGYYVLPVLYTIARLLNRVSIILFYIRVFRTSQSEPLLWKTLYGSIVMSMPLVLVAIFECTPVSFYWLGWDGESSGHCIDRKSFLWAVWVILLLYDFWILGVPMPSVAKLQLSLRKKVLVAIMFSTGLA
ncbi:Uu.00g031120.m01.CDS01 [Anthostomella pinea]|uniref:Uu.00g031120.m01.CDS01 n=1 Tax=Anthostomella pinea TaxID=933095 RepID=A0AAI8V8A5_9PEZI|nr:Uu.00g031120.m01.CDS01 [Anthostomella pinea]